MLVIVLPSHAADSATETTWPRRDVDVKSYTLATLLPSHPGEGAAEVTRPWRDVDPESSSDDATKSCW
jgi:hypothetical protein